MSSILPTVAKSFFTFCKKCDADRYHTVLAHTSSKSAKMKCEVCGASRTYNLPSVAALKSGKPSAAAMRRSSSSGSAGVKPSGRGMMSASARQSAHLHEYESLMEKEGSLIPYNMKVCFTKNQKMDHPKFGQGVVREIFKDKVEVVFKDEVRSLVHNRSV